jgi:ADP-ribosylglycohydrolase
VRRQPPIAPRAADLRSETRASPSRLLALREGSKQTILAGVSIQGASEIVLSGYVVESMNAALQCFADTCTFQGGCLGAANLGEDSDTIAAIYGQLAGAHSGESGIPGHRGARLCWASRIRATALQ